MFDAEKFIKEVQGQPTIWKTDNLHFNNRFHKRLAWEEVARNLCSKFDTYSERQRMNIVENFQKKWRNYRDYHLKLRKTGKAIKRKSPYLSLLTFLDVNIPNTRKVKEITEMHSSSEDDHELYKSENVRQKQYYNGTIDTQNRGSEFVEINCQPTNATNVASYFEDPDRSFLISLLPDMKLMDEKQKFLFKLKIMQLVREMNYKETYVIERSKSTSQDPLVNPKCEPIDDDLE
ncbi:hypothetical protein ACJJTC_009031 [Scirpophaga incertulas]